MVWWIHLLVRRADLLCDRVAVLERTLRAVGRLRYGEQCDPLLTWKKYRGYLTERDPGGPHFHFLTERGSSMGVSWSDGSRHWFYRDPDLPDSVELELHDYSGNGRGWVHRWGCAPCVVQAYPDHNLRRRPSKFSV
jgi:hypothetical protein